MVGIHYANEDSSGTCRRCGRPLTDPGSIAAGIGPECAHLEADNVAFTAAWPVGTAIRVTGGSTEGMTGEVAGYARKQGRVTALVLQLKGRTRTFLDQRPVSQVERIGAVS